MRVVAEGPRQQTAKLVLLADEDVFTLRLIREFGLADARQRVDVVERFRRTWPGMCEEDPRAFQAGVLDELKYEGMERPADRRKRRPAERVRRQGLDARRRA